MALIAVLGACTDLDQFPTTTVPPVDTPAGTSTAAAGQGSSARAAGGDLFVVEGVDATVSADGDSWTVSMAVERDVLAFTDRPARGASRFSAAELVDSWASYGFDDDPPNAALTGTTTDGSQFDVAVEMTGVAWDQQTGTLTFSATAIGADRGVSLPGQLTSVSLFIDDATSGVMLDITLADLPATLTYLGTTTSGSLSPLEEQRRTVDLRLQWSMCTEKLASFVVVAASGCQIHITDPTPGIPSTTTVRLGSWVVTVTFAADGSANGTIAQPEARPADWPFWPFLLDYREIEDDPDLAMPLKFERGGITTTSLIFVGVGGPQD